MSRMVTILLTLLMVSGATAGITVSSTYHIADANAMSSLYGGDSDVQAGSSPVSAFAQVAGDLGSSTASANSNLLQVDSFASVAVLPVAGAFNGGFARSTATHGLLGLASDTAWTLALQVGSSMITSPGGQGSWEAVAVLLSGATPVYVFSSATDGTAGGGVFGPGSYTLVLTSASMASASVEGAGTFEFADVANSLTAAVGIVAVPAPGAFALVGMGVLLVDRLRRRSGRF